MIATIEEFEPPRSSIFGAVLAGLGRRMELLFLTYQKRGKNQKN